MTENQDKILKKEYLGIESLIRDDILFFFLFLIGYPDSKPSKITFKEIMELKLKGLKEHNIKRILKELKKNTNLKIDKDNWNIKTTEKTIFFVRKGIEEYIKKFNKGDLPPSEKNCLLYKKQKNIFLKILKEKIENEGMHTSIDDDELPEKCRLLETMISLEGEHLIDIKEIKNSRNLNDKTYFRVIFKVKNKLLVDLGLKEKMNRKITPKCYPKKNYGYLKIKSSSRERRIGAINSRYFMLLEFLANDKGIDENVPLKEAYNAIKDGKHYEKQSYENEDVRAIQNAIKSLQKDSLIYPLKIVLDKEEKTVRLTRG